MDSDWHDFVYRVGNWQPRLLARGRMFRGQLWAPRWLLQSWSHQGFEVDFVNLLLWGESSEFIGRYTSILPNESHVRKVFFSAGPRPLTSTPLAAFGLRRRRGDPARTTVRVDDLRRVFSNFTYTTIFSVKNQEIMALQSCHPK